MSNNQSNTNRTLPDKKGSWIVSLLPDLAAIIFFIALSFAYFIKPVSEGLVLTGQDHSGGTGAASEMEAYRKAHDGERTRWTNVLFSGMPTYQIAPSYPSTERLTKVESVYKLGLPDYVVLVFVMLLGFYILLRAFDFKAWMAALGAVLWAFSSYYFIIIGAGHIWKFYTLAYIPPTIAGMVLCYRGRYGWGLIVTSLFMALQILSNHVQMSYYFAFVIALMALAFLFEMTTGESKLSATPEGKSHSSFFRWLKATATFALGCLIGIAINASNLYHTWEYSKESMRGKSELTQQTKDPQNQTSSGLERDYITAWSYGIGETWSLLVPNVKGGASVPLTQSKTAMKKANQMYLPVYQSLGQYWGEQPGTSGPVYVGAFVLFLFVLGLFIVKGPMKWALAIATLLSITLAWGKNFMPWTDFWLDYVPMYDKFRTVASILVIAEFTIPLLAMMALKEIVQTTNDELRMTNKSNLSGSSDSKSYSSFLLALAFTALPCLLFWLTPDTFFGSYVSTAESQMFNAAAQQGYIPQEMLAPIMANLNEMRSAVVSADAGRSLLIILVGCAVLAAYYFRKIKAWAMVGCLIVLCTADLWDVNKRYLSDDMFSAPQAVQQSLKPTPTDEAILQDTDPYYRVANLSVSTFNDNTTSTFHKSIGGYHAAKLRRYQELIEAYIQPELINLHQTAAATAGRLDSVNADSLFPVLNMLNMKYAILPLQDGQTIPVQNPWAMGNAWFVDDVLLVGSADEELAALGAIQPRTTAVVDNRFRSLLPDHLVSGGGPKEQAPSTPAEGKPHGLKLVSYEANALTFEAETPQERLAVFSDVYYPGWRCTIDDKEVDLLRANYVLRAVVVPAGKHTIAFRFDPQSLHATEALANTALILLAVLALILIAWAIFKQRKAKNA
ncbi:MAG: YfhO family protein [Bacteroidaceae bacterium]|nr:YfhO family protein [Bacteroidaceae bacterium]